MADRSRLAATCAALALASVALTAGARAQRPAARPRPPAHAARPAPGAARTPAPDRPPVDLSDTLTCYRELAELASFALLLSGSDDFRPGAAGGALGVRPDPAELARRLERLDRLAGSPDPSVKAAARTLRGLSLDVWRTYKANYELCSNGGKWESRAAACLPAVKVLQKAVDGIESKARKDATYIARGQGTYRDADGERQPIEVESVDPARYSARLRALSGEAALELARLRTQAAKAVAAAAREQTQAEKEMTQLNAARRLLQSRAESLWQETLLPRLTGAAGPPAPKPVVEFGDPHKLSPRGPVRLRAGFGSVFFRNVSGRRLTHVALTFRMEGAGPAKTWYGYVDRLEPGQYGLAFYNGPWVSPVGTGLGLDEPGEILAVAMAAYSDEARDVGRSVTVQKLKPDIEVPQRPDAGAGKADPEDLVNAMLNEQRLGIFPLGDVAPRVPDNAERYDRILKNLRGRYPAPRTEAAARAALLEALRAGRTQEVRLNDADPPKTLKLQVEPIANGGALVRARITPGSKTDPRLTGYVGRFVTEPERGAVVALVPDEKSIDAAFNPVEPADAPDAADRPADPPPPAKAAPSRPGRRKTRPSPSLPPLAQRLGEGMQRQWLAEARDRLRGVLAGQVFLVTDCDEAWRTDAKEDVRNLMTATTHPRDLPALERARRTAVVPPYVLALDGDGRLSLQSNTPPERWLEPLDPPGGGEPAAGRGGATPRPDLAQKLQKIRGRVQVLNFQNIPARRRHKLDALASLDRAILLANGGGEYGLELSNVRASLNALLEMDVSQENREKLETLLEALDDAERGP